MDSMYGVIESYRHLKCSDSRDKVYGFLTLGARTRSTSSPSRPWTAALSGCWLSLPTSARARQTPYRSPFCHPGCRIDMSRQAELPVSALQRGYEAAAAVPKLWRYSELYRVFRPRKTGCNVACFCKRSRGASQSCG